MSLKNKGLQKSRSKVESEEEIGNYPINLRSRWDLSLPKFAYITIIVSCVISITLVIILAFQESLTEEQKQLMVDCRWFWKIGFYSNLILISPKIWEKIKSLFSPCS
jgi:hypothetical protein